MKKFVFLQSVLLTLSLATTELYAQFPPRVEDHFWRRKVVNKIDLTEKVNQPLVMQEHPFYRQYNEGQEVKGMVVALMDGLKRGDYVAYNSDSLEKPLQYNEVMALLDEAKGKEKKEAAPADEGDGFEDLGGEDAGGGGDFGDEFGFGDEESSGGGEAAPPSGEIGFGGAEYTPLESYLLFVEDRIFDKNRSDMVYDIQFIQLIFVDPGGVLRDKPICTFKYKEVMALLEKTQWKNKFNDAEYRNMREIFELRLFNSFITNVSNINYGVKTLEEAEFRKQQLVEFEHHLWSY